MAMATRTMRQESEPQELKALEAHMMQLAQYLAENGLLKNGKLAGYFLKQKNDENPSGMLVKLPGGLRAVFYQFSSGTSEIVNLLDPRKKIKPDNSEETVSLRGLSGEKFKGATYGGKFFATDAAGLAQSGLAGSKDHWQMTAHLGEKSKVSDVYFIYPKAGMKYKEGIW